MPLAPGVRLGPYEIVSLIGTGGMGEVYKARDTRLDRPVAIKVLPPELANDAERRARFSREAKTISTLNHPHICTLYDVGEAAQTGDQAGIAQAASDVARAFRPAPTSYLVMEHLDGETLAERLRRGALPLPQALDCAAQILDALAAAHKQGVIHRDLKPGNIFLVGAHGTGSASGIHVKLLDFGLAKLKGHGEQPAAATLMSPPTRTEPLTGEGAILGTLQYMAPEQLEGKEADARTDLFAFGAVVYEMLTGRRAFEGNSAASLIGAILEREPLPLRSFQAGLPPSLEHIVQGCLAKNPEERWQSARDVRREVEWVARHGQDAGPLPERRAGRRVAGLLLLVAATAAAAGLLLGRSAGAPALAHVPPVRFVVPLPGTDTVEPALWPAVAVAPDGSRFAYVATRGGTSHLFLRDLKSLEPVLLPGTDGAGGPFFSPDGQSVGFFAAGKLMKLSLNGGAPVVLCEATAARGASWGGDGTILFTPAPGTGIWRIDENGGTPEVVTQLSAERKERTHRWADVLPGDRTAIVTARSPEDRSFDETDIAAVDLQTGSVRAVLEGGSQARYAPTGHLLFVRSSSLYAVPFDARTAQVIGAPVLVVEGIVTDPSTGAAHYGISGNGSLVYVAGGPWTSERTLVWASLAGEIEPLAIAPRTYQTARVSPDGRRIAVVAEAANDDLWIVERGSFVRLTYETGSSIAPVWASDGSQLAFASNSAGSYKVFAKAVDDIEPPVQLSEGTNIQIPGSWSPDRQLLAFIEVDPATGADIWILSPGKPHSARPFLRTRFNEDGPAFSPDGRWIAYASDESGRREVYVRPFPGEGGKRQVSSDGGGEPVWSRAGDALFYRNGTHFMLVPVALSPGLRVGTPKLIVEGRYVTSRMAGLPSYDVSPDGRRLLLARENQEPAPTRLHVILNWFEELKAKVPAGR